MYGIAAKSVRTHALVWPGLENGSHRLTGSFACTYRCNVDRKLSARVVALAMRRGARHSCATDSIFSRPSDLMCGGVRLVVRRQVAGGTAEDKDEKLRQEARQLFKALCGKLDALTRFHFAPKPVIEDMTVKSEVGGGLRCYVLVIHSRLTHCLLNILLQCFCADGLRTVLQAGRHWHSHTETCPATAYC